ncbi:MAG: MATE family efflux transporter [Bacteroidales bacterium]|nr:MATE family efflux transporter [Bacteroidales bacterium]
MTHTTVKYKEIWTIAYPIILSSIVHNIIGVTDTAFLGRVGVIELGAAAIGSVFYLTIIMLGFGFAVGTQIIVARRFGENNPKEIGKTIEQSLYFLTALAIVLILVMLLNLPVIFKSLLQSAEVEKAATEYLKYRIFGLLFAFIMHGFRAFYIGIARTSVITHTTIIMAFANIFLDYVLIFGELGFPEMGIAGAAIASVVSELLATLFFIVYTLKFVDTKYFQLFQFKKIDFGYLYRILKVAFPTMMQNFVSFIGWFFFFLFVEQLGESSLAVSNIIRSVYVVMLIPIWGFSSAANTLVSYSIGRNAPNDVMPIIYKVLKLTLIGVFALVIINLIFPQLILMIYTNDKALIASSLPSLYVVCVASLFIAVGFVFFSGVSGSGNTKVSLIIETFVIFIYVLATYLLANIENARVEIVWTVEVIYGFIIAAISFLYLKYGKWQNKRI